MQEKDPNNGLDQCAKMETVGRKGRVTTESKDIDAKTMLCVLKESNSLMKADIGDSNLYSVNYKLSVSNLYNVH